MTESHQAPLGERPRARRTAGEKTNPDAGRVTPAASAALRALQADATEACRVLALPALTLTSCDPAPQNNPSGDAARDRVYLNLLAQQPGLAQTTLDGASLASLGNLSSALGAVTAEATPLGVSLLREIAGHGRALRQSCDRALWLLEQPAGTRLAPGLTVGRARELLAPFLAAAGVSASPAGPDLDHRTLAAGRELRDAARRARRVRAPGGEP